MKIRKAFSLLMGVVLTISAASQTLPISADAVDETSSQSAAILGDINLDGELTIGDAAMIQKYLLSQQSIAKEQWEISDINADSTVNAFDLCLLRKDLLDAAQAEDKITYQIDYEDIRPYLDPEQCCIDMDEFVNFTESIITSIEELNTYIGLKPAFSEICYAYYDEAFFENNVLLLSASLEYEYMEDPYYIGDTLIIPYYSDNNTKDLDLKYPDGVLSLKQVVVPKTLYHADTVIWKWNAELPSTKFQLETAMEQIEGNADFYSFVNSSKYYSNATITSVDTLTTYLEKFASDADIVTYTQKYDDAFFENNVLYLNAIYQGSGSDIMYKIGYVAYGGPLLYIHYHDTYEANISYADVESNLLAQVVMPKEQYKTASTIWTYDNNHNDFPILQRIKISLDQPEKPETTAAVFKAECSGDITSKASIENVYGIDWMTTNHTRLVGTPIQVKFDEDVENPELTIYYDESKLDGVTEDNLIVLYYYYEDGFQAFPQILNVTQDKENNTITFKTQSNIGENKQGIYLLAKDK